MKLLVTLLLAVTASQSVFSYEWVVNPANGHYYTSWEVDGSGWEGAQAIAASLGGNLVTINDLEENEWLRETFAGFEFCWIGLYKTDDPTLEWAWISGEPVDFLWWDEGEPGSDPSRRWAALSESTSLPGRWVTLSGDVLPDDITLPHIAVVEVVSEPPILPLLIFCSSLLLRRR